MRILLAEDNPLNQRLVAHDFGRARSLGSVVSNGYDLVPMNERMPEMNGGEAAREIGRKEEMNQKHQLAIASAAHNLESGQERCPSAAIDGCLTKPIRQQELCQLVNQHAAARIATVGPVDDPVLDKAGALTLLAGDEEMLQELCALFLEQSEVMVAGIGQAIADGHPVTLQRAAHTLKGAASALCATRTTQLAHRIEKLGQNCHLEEAAALLPALQEEVGTVHAAIRVLIGETGN